ncbi:MAG TPA: glycosyltransferase, partial [Terriglobales bacterium]|nr:glycosyltransferase [Terriglobales bacterium]
MRDLLFPTVAIYNPPTSRARMGTPGYSIVIPAYNESERICHALDRVLEHIGQQQWDAEIIVVNDGSRDHTADLVRGYAAQHPA